MIGRARAGPLGGAVVVVTGATSGIGLATARAVLVAGGQLVAVGRRPLRSVLGRSCPGDATPLVLSLDVRKPADMAEMADRTLDRFGRIDVLVACAGLLRAGSPATVANLPVDEWDLVLDTNLRGVFLSNRAVLPAMLRQRQGTIVNLSSTSGRRGLAYDAAYCASKFGVIGFSESLAEEVRPHGIKVSVVLPGAVDTPLWEQNGPLPRPTAILPPERVADLVTYLVSLPEDTLVVQPTVVGFRSRRVRAGGSAE